MPQIITPGEDLLEDACTELWYDPDVLADEQSIEPEVAAQAILEATAAIKILTGQQFSGPQCWLEDYIVSNGQSRLRLKRDIDVLYYAKIIDEACAEDVPAEIETDLDGACVIGDRLIKFASPGARHMFDPMYASDAVCAPAGGTLRVMYRTKNNVPLGADRVVARLSHEYVLACNGDARCRLPERLTSVTRQGVSWSVLGPDEFLKLGLIGIGQIDHWLNVVMTTARGLYGTNPLELAPRRRAVLLGCGEDCSNVSSWPEVES